MRRERLISSFLSRFTHAHLALRPLEGTWLGLRVCDHKLEDISPQGIHGQILFYRNSAETARQFLRSTKNENQRMDLKHILSLCRFNLHLLRDRPEHASDLEHISEIYETLTAQEVWAASLKEWEDIIERILALPSFLGRLTSHASQRGKHKLHYDRNHLKDLAKSLHSIVQHFESIRTRALKSLGSRTTQEFLHKMDRASCAAAEALRRFHLSIQRKFLPMSHTAYAIGEKEYRTRLLLGLGISKSPGELQKFGYGLLKNIHARMRNIVRSQGWKEPLPQILKHLSGFCPRDDEHLFKVYRRFTDRAQEFVRRQNLFSRIPQYSLRLIPTPSGMGEALTTAAYYPAPPFNSKRKGAFLVTPSRGDKEKLKAHALYHAVSTAVHEAFPGHDMQYFLWQTANPKLPVVRFLKGDPKNWGESLNVEGYAHYAEELMRQHGFYSRREELFQWVGQAWRASRIVVDIGLHCYGMSLRQAAKFLEKNAFLDPKTAKGEAFRYSKWPTQAITYSLGKREIEKLKEKYRRKTGNHFSESRFHDWFLSFGPIPPQKISTSLAGKSIPGDGTSGGSFLRR
ncbi:MAG: DUF885 domain-containing protein [Elusimicrobia bacterium]|nr:DUF885 domain-containing protein [Elusimicrobiota bacterium]